jgi:hypothetical protein
MYAYEGQELPKLKAQSNEQEIEVREALFCSSYGLNMSLRTTAVNLTYQEGKQADPRGYVESRFTLNEGEEAVFVSTEK